MKDLLTASRIRKLQQCPRAHELRYERQLVRIEQSDALTFGTAWHKVLELRATGADAQTAFEAAVDLVATPEQQMHLHALTEGYYRQYADDTLEITPEVEFCFALRSGRGAMWAAGKIDGLAPGALIEHKTTSSDISPASDYWLKLRADVQILQYITGARSLGHDVPDVIYDVARKPTIVRKQSVPQLDEEGNRIIVDKATGERVYKKDGGHYANPPTGARYETREETLIEYRDRIAADIAERPEFYFARRMVPVLENDLERFEKERADLAKEILWRRRNDAWPRNVSDRTCGWCEYARICLQGVEIDGEVPPSGYEYRRANSELTEEIGQKGKVV